MKNLSQEIEFVRHELENSLRILVVSHIRPDGDAVGSLLGFGLALQVAEKQVQMVLSDGVPASFKHLPGVNQIRKNPVGSFDYIIVVDCSDIDRVGDALNGYQLPDLNIDHHVTNLNFARTNLVETGAAATAEILAAYLPSMGLEINTDVSIALLTGMITDSLGFRTPSMTPQTLRLAADLMEKGADLPDLYYKAQIEKSFVAIRYWGKGLHRVQREGPLIWTSLTLEDRKAIDYPGRDDADLINVLASVGDCDVAVIFVEQPDQKVKISWRARSGYDTSQIALSFGGGGHLAASGAEVEGSLEEVEALVLTETRRLFVETEKYLKHQKFIKTSSVGS